MASQPSALQTPPRCISATSHNSQAAEKFRHTALKVQGRNWERSSRGLTRTAQACPHGFLWPRLPNPKAGTCMNSFSALAHSSTILPWHRRRDYRRLKAAMARSSLKATIQLGTTTREAMRNSHSASCEAALTTTSFVPQRWASESSWRTYSLHAPKARIRMPPNVRSESHRTHRFGQPFIPSIRHRTASSPWRFLGRKKGPKGGSAKHAELRKVYESTSSLPTHKGAPACLPLRRSRASFSPVTSAAFGTKTSWRQLRSRHMDRGLGREEGGHHSSNPWTLRKARKVFLWQFSRTVACQIALHGQYVGQFSIQPAWTLHIAKCPYCILSLPQTRDKAAHTWVMQ